MQLDEAITFMKAKLKEVGDKYEINKIEFEAASGVGINVTEEDIRKMVDEAFKENAKEIDEQGWDFNFNKINYALQEKNKWADRKTLMAFNNEKQVALLGEKPANTGKR